MVWKQRDLASGAGAVGVLLVVLSGPFLATLDKASRDAQERSEEAADDYREAGR